MDWWGAKALSDVRRTTCAAYVKHRTSQPIRHGSTGRMVTAQTARRELELLSAAIGYWDGEHHLTRRPAVILPEKPESNRDALSRAQAAALIWAAMGWDRIDGKWKRPSTNARTNRMHLRRFLLIGLYTGSRSDVIKRLCWSESLHDPWVDLDAGIIYRRGRGEQESRTKRRPLVKLPNRLLAHMRRWQALDAKAGRTTVLHFGGEPVGSVRTSFASCVAGAGLKPEVTPHWLRHTAATWLVERNVDTWEAAGYLGMTAATLEKHYGHHRPDHQSAARKAMG
jgi:integrase